MVPCLVASASPGGELGIKAYICLATSAHYARLIEGVVGKDKRHGQYGDEEYRRISDTAFESIQRIAERVEVPPVVIAFGGKATAGKTRGVSQFFTG